MKKTKKLLLSLFALMTAMPAAAQTNDGMFYYAYDHDTQTATLTYREVNDSKGGTYVGDVVVPAKAPNGYDVTVIGGNAFINSNNMTSLTIPATIDSIGCQPFENCSAHLTKIIIEDGDTPLRCHVQDAWPRGCFPVFGRDVQVDEIYIGRNYHSFVSRGWVEAVYEGSWSLIRDSEYLKTVTMGDVFTEVPYAMFYGCTQLQTVNISPNVTSVGKAAFWNCAALTDINLPDGVEVIDEEAFGHCKSLEPFDLPNALKFIGAKAFLDCDMFRSFTIPASVDSLGVSILDDCDSLKRIDIAYSPTPLKMSCSNQFNNSLRSAPIDTLWTDRYIDGAFSDNRTLKKIYIGSKVEALHDYLFSDCYSVDEIFSMNPVPPTCEGGSVFYSGIKQNGTLHVPASSIDAYKEAYVWKDFFNIQPIDSDEPSEPTLTQKQLFATRLADMNTARMSHQIMPVDDGIVVFGGHTTGFSMTRTAERYSFANDSWTQMDMLYYQDYSAGIVTADGKMLLAGGMSGGGGTGASAQCELYDPSTNTFTSTGSMVQARSMATATMTESGKIYVNGCWYNSSYGLECYDPETESFSKVADGLNAYHPNLLALRGERVAIADGSSMIVAEDGTTTSVESDLLAEYPIMKGWDEMQMAYYQVADYSYILLGRSNTQAVLLNVYDDATEGVKITKVADLPMTLPDNESIGIGYHDQVSRVFIDRAAQKLYVQTCVINDGYSPIIVEYDYPSAQRLEGGSIVVYATDEPLEQRTENAAWTMLDNGTLVSVGGGESNFAPHEGAYIYTLGGDNEEPNLAKDEEGYYLIASVDDWKLFSELTLTDPTASARMTEDINLGDDQTMVGTVETPYQGSFDGQGHTLTVAYSQDVDILAPFRYVNGATIQRIHVTGTVDSQSKRNSAGIISFSTGGTTTISECWSSVTLRGYDTMGGICSVVQDGTTNINDCLFDGFISGNVYNGGFASHCDPTATINFNNGLFMGDGLDAYWSGTFFRTDCGWFGPRNLNNSYYVTPYGYPQGIQATDEQLANGTIANALQAGRAEQIWVQDMDMNQPMLLVFSKNPDPDGISLIPAFSQDEGDWYDLGGRKVSGKPAQGIYIVNGKKVVIK